MATKPKAKAASKKMPAIAIMIVPKMKGKENGKMDKDMMKKHMKDKC